MPVYKYRRAGDMPAPGRAGATDVASRIRVLWARAFLLCPPTVPRGVRRFRTIAEANEERQRETVDRIRRRSLRR